MTARKPKKPKREKFHPLWPQYDAELNAAADATDTWAGTESAADKLACRNAIIQAAQTRKKIDAIEDEDFARSIVAHDIAVLITDAYAKRIYAAIANHIFDVEVG